MEAIYNENLLLGSRIIEGRYYLAGKTLSTCINGRNAERIQFVRIELNDGACLITIEENTVVKILIFLCCI